MLLDASILIDLLRGNPAAYDFVSSLHLRPALSVLSATEMIAGCKNVTERRQIDHILVTNTILEIELDVAVLAGAFMKQFAKSHRLEPIDAIIAATAKHHDLPLVTHNLKHFPMFPGLKRPY
jgi:predicted nucleic acid-binding protein